MEMIIIKKCMHKNLRYKSYNIYIYIYYYLLFPCPPYLDDYLGLPSLADSLRWL